MDVTEGQASVVKELREGPLLIGTHKRIANQLEKKGLIRLRGDVMELTGKGHDVAEALVTKEDSDG